MSQTTTETDEDYFPLFWNSLLAALIALSSSFFVAAYLATQWAGSVELRFWNHVVPYLALNASQATFLRINQWSALITAGVLVFFAVSAFVRGERLQIQAGRSFAWIDVALIGALNLTRAWWFDNATSPQAWMYLLVFGGLVGFAVSTGLIWIDYKDREASAENAEQSTNPSEATSPAEATSAPV